ncbi:MAG: hypothetical protein PHW53_03875 [Patescibacteria group bacterium]|nr:hypothetical protein [Patescibacteria group bacterium]
MLCSAEQLDEVRDEFPRNRVIFSDDHEEAFRLAGEIVEQHHAAERRSRAASTTVYCFISSAA